jgi:AcrR family transcriptional regulator
VPTPPVWTLPPPPARQRALDRPSIVAAAVALADGSGADAVTMKAVAASLGPYTPMALYRYVHSKDGLVDLMLDAVLSEVALHPADAWPVVGADWRTALRSLLGGTREMFQRHPWCPALIHTRPPVGPHAMRRTEFMLTVLTGQGASLADAMTYAALLERYVIGSGVQEAQEAAFERDIDLTAAVMSMSGLAQQYGDVPLMAQWLAAPSGGDADVQFALGLDFLLDGIAARLLAP